MIGPGELLSVTPPFHEDYGVVGLCSPLADQDFLVNKFYWLVA